MDDNLSAAGWHGHEWVEPKARLVRVAAGCSVVQRHCARCHRDFIFTPSSERNAVFVSAVSFFLLDEEVTNRWVNLPCPGSRLLSDDDDRKRRIAELCGFLYPRDRDGAPESVSKPRAPSLFRRERRHRKGQGS